MTEVADLAAASIATARLALAFGKVNRSACRHLDGTPESDADHTVAVAWISAALAPEIAPGLDPAEVAAYGVVHDAVEVFSGDEPTLRITAAGRVAKEALEQAAARRWQDELGATVPWLPRMIASYQEQRHPATRYVRAIDKVAAKLVHIIHGCTDLAGAGITVAEMTGLLARERAAITSYAGEFPLLIALHDEVAGQVLALLGKAWEAAAPGQDGTAKAGTNAR